MTLLPRLLRHARTLVVVTLVGAATALVPAVVPNAAPPAAAYSTYLCSGYSECKAAGYSDAGYGARSGQMYWRMYSGHNCTNYVAYRMIQAGMSSERPWGGSGMAYNWGHAMASKTDSRPAVGAVAWFDAGAAGMSSSGHVAYVEKVVSPTEIVISEDSWSGTCRWRTIEKSSGSWPSGFIHLVDRALKSTAAPTVSGTPAVGSTLTASKGSWSPAPGQVSYQWLADGEKVRGATDSTFEPTVDQVGDRISVEVTASKARYAGASSTSKRTAPVAAGKLQATTSPTLEGDDTVGSTLVASPGIWSAKPDVRGFRWQLNGVTMKGVSGRRLTLTDRMVGKKVSLVQVARKEGYEKGVARAQRVVGPVVAGEVTTSQPFAVSGKAEKDQTLTISPRGLAPRDAKAAYTWLRDGQKIAGATGTTYRLGREDVGHAIRAKVSLSKARFRGLVRNFDFGTVTTQSHLRVGTTGRKRVAVVGVHLRGRGMGLIDGPVTVRLGKRETTARVVDGFARVVLKHVKPGDRPVRVTFAGNDVVGPSSGTAKVRVTR